MARHLIALSIEDQSLFERVVSALERDEYHTVRLAPGQGQDESAALVAAGAVIMQIGPEGATASAERFLGELRAAAVTAPVPVICLMDREALAGQHKLRERFGVDVLAMPFDADQLLLKVRAVLRPRPGDLARTQPQPPGAGGGEQPVSGRAADVVEEASEESFPASDAPGWTRSGIGGAGEEGGEGRDDPRR